MFYYSITWYLLCVGSNIGCFIYHFGDIGNGNSRELVRFIGGILFFLFMGVSFVMYGWKGGIAIVLVQLVTSFPVRIIAGKVLNILFRL